MAVFMLLTACEDLDLMPLSEASAENWYSNEEGLVMALNDLYSSSYWGMDWDGWTDDMIGRDELTPVTTATIDGQYEPVVNLWSNSYKGISSANTILSSLNTLKDLSEETRNRYEAEARCIRAYIYSRLISKFGDVVFYTKNLSVEEAFTIGRTDKEIVVDSIYADFDFAAANLSESYNGLKRITKGAALALKARTALYNEDWLIASQAAKACMDLGMYNLHPDFGELFLAKTKNTEEVIMSIPRSVELGFYIGTRGEITRNAGGYNYWTPSWELWAAFPCVDGLPIDKSPLFDPREPFKNRDPRCAMSIVEFQTEHLGFMYQPHPDSLEVLNFETGLYQKNNDTRSVIQYASYNGLAWKKKIDMDWADDLKADNDLIIIRYADVLLIYAEAMIEQGQIDQSVRDAMNTVRARAYGVGKEETESYPEITSTDQSELRRIVRNERRIEFAWEGLRYMDIIRWKIAEKTLNRSIYGMLDPEELKAKVVSRGLWFWPMVPEIDEDGIANFDPMYEAGYCKQIAVTAFDTARQYLWPVPTKEILINDNLKQNPNY